MNQITLTQLLGSVWRHRRVSGLAFLSVLLLTASIFVLAPRKYGSEGRLFVRLGRNNSGLDPTNGSQNISIQDSRETEILSVAEIAKSRAVIEQVVDRVGSDRINQSWWGAVEAPGSSELDLAAAMRDGGIDAATYRRLRNREQAARTIERNLTVKTEKKTSVISVFVRANTPQLAREIAVAILDATREKHLEVHSVGGSTEFFDSEFEKHQRLVDEAITRQAEFRSDLGILSLEGARGTLQQIISRLENDLISAEVELAQAEERVSRLDQELAKIEATIEVPVVGRERLSFEDSRTELYRLKNERARLAATMSDENPVIRQLDEAIREAESGLQSMTVDRTESAREINPVFENIKTSQVQALADRAAAASRFENLRRKKVDAEGRLADLNAAEVTAEQFRRSVEIAKQYLSTYATKRGESRVLQELDRQRISDLVIAQPATLMLKKVSPRGSILFPIGLVAAGLAALGVALICDRADDAPKDADEPKELLGVPVLVTLPRVSTHHNMVN